MSDDNEDDNLRCASGKARLYVEADLAAGADLTLDKDQSHYLVNVIRMGIGARVLLFNGRDGEWAGEITEASRKSASVSLVAQTRPHEPLPDIWLLFAPVKKARLDFIAQKATEMGAAVIQPVLTRRTIVSRIKDERLAANVIEAAEQCGLVCVPEVREAEKLTHLLDHWTANNPARQILFCNEAAPPGGALTNLETIAKAHPRGTPFALLVGPEGGFDPQERAALLKRTDTHALSLGPRIMRADTAAIAALAAVQLVLGDW
ncbi:MAG: 16S rRNA (uracil(1498)-N(3))-methyltransferase [Parvibaculum sp.]|nr:16S rRNA (uracil(1498)-N(3))-methyltransferase [Parvibaculum sp.]